MTGRGASGAARRDAARSRLAGEEWRTSRRHRHRRAADAMLLLRGAPNCHFDYVEAAVKDISQANRS